MTVGAPSVLVWPRRLVWGLVLLVLCAGIYALAVEVDPLDLREQWLLLVLAAIVLLGAAFARDIRAWLLSLSADAQNLVLVTCLGAVPIVLLLVQVPPLVQGAWSQMFLRALFACSLTALPGVLYYSSAATRRRSALNELIVAFRRFQLITTPMMLRASKRRMESYLQQFEAIHGTLPNRSKLIGDVFAGTAEQSDSLAEDPQHGVLRAMPRPMLVHLIAMVMLMAIGWTLVYPPLGQAVEHSPLRPQPTLFNAAFIGAYIYILVTMVTRWIRHDLNVQACMAATKQLVFAMLGSVVLVFLDFDELGTSAPFGTLATALLVGVFPNHLLHLLTSLYYRLTQRGGGQSKADASLSKLDGLSLWNEARLQEEGIDDVHSLASADLIELSMRTRLQPDLLVEWADQAMLKSQLIHAMPTYEHLRGRAITKATELVQQLLDPVDDLIDMEHQAIVNRVARNLLELRSAFEDIRNWRAQVAPCTRIPIR
jgi:hypothetical protein